MSKGFLILCSLSLSIGVFAAALNFQKERSELHEERLVGALAIVEILIEASQGPSTELYSPSIEPRIDSNYWTLTGIAVRQDTAGGRGYLPYSAVLESTCLPYSNLDCWRIESLTIDDGSIEIATEVIRDNIPAPDPIEIPSPPTTDEFEPSVELETITASSEKTQIEIEPSVELETVTASSENTQTEFVAPAKSGVPEKPSIVHQNMADEPAHMASSEDTLVSLIQFALEELGFDPGPADGKLGPRTTAAIEAYQRSYDLQAEGQPTERLLEHMEKRLNITD